MTQFEVLRLRAALDEANTDRQLIAEENESWRRLRGVEQLIAERDEALSEVNRLYRDIEAYKMAADEASRELDKIQMQRDRAVRERTVMQAACHKADAELVDARAVSERLAKHLELAAEFIESAGYADVSRSFKDPLKSDG
jgi:hypothetical protein